MSTITHDEAEDRRLRVQQLRDEASAIQASGILGKSFHLNSLFDYLLERSITGAQPKENEIAMDVFGKQADVNLGQDATVRVNVHRLRKKLQDHYLSAGKDSRVFLQIPKGDYRLELVDREIEAPDQSTQPETGTRRSYWLYVLLPLTLVAGLAAGMTFDGWFRDDPPARDGGVRSMAPWKALAKNSSRVIVTVSDFPLPDGSSRNPGYDGIERFLPIGSAMALNAALPVVARSVSPPRTLNVLPTSQITPGMVVNSDIVYVGYLGGLGLLHDIVFAQSRYSPGASPRELIDKKSGRRFIADPFFPESTEQLGRRDYGLIMSFPGPKGGRIIVLGGTSDMAMIQVSETATDPASLGTLLGKLSGSDRFEALYEVKSIGNRNVHARLLEASPLPPFSWTIGKDEPRAAD